MISFPDEIDAEKRTGWSTMDVTEGAVQKTALLGVYFLVPSTSSDRILTVCDG